MNCDAHGLAYLLLVVGIAAAVACDSRKESGNSLLGDVGTITGTDSGIGSDSASDFGPPPDCSMYEGLVTPEEADRTPRVPGPDHGIELLALRMSNAVVAPYDVYVRVNADLVVIMQETSIEGVGCPPQDLGQLVGLFASPEILDAILAGTYPATHCQNQLYGVQKMEPDDRGPNVIRVELALDGIYDMAAIAAEYRRLPGIDDARPGLGYSGCDASQWIGGCVAGDAYYYTASTALGAAPELYVSYPGEAPALLSPDASSPCEFR